MLQLLVSKLKSVFVHNLVIHLQVGHDERFWGDENLKQDSAQQFAAVCFFSGTSLVFQSEKAAPYLLVNEQSFA